MLGKGQALPESYLKEITKKYSIISKPQHKNNRDHRDSLKNESPPSSTVQTQEAVTREELFCTMAPEVQPLVNVVYRPWGTVWTLM